MAGGVTQTRCRRSTPSGITRPVLRRATPDRPRSADERLVARSTRLRPATRGKFGRPRLIRRRACHAVDDVEEGRLRRTAGVEAFGASRGEPVVFPDAREVRPAVGRSRRRSREVGLPIRGPRYRGRRVFQPLRERGCRCGCPQQRHQGGHTTRTSRASVHRRGRSSPRKPPNAIKKKSITRPARFSAPHPPPCPW